MFNATTLQQMNEKKNEKMINIDEKLAENIKIKEIIRKKFLKKKENFDTMMFDNFDVKNSNIMIFIKHHIDDTTMISNNFTKFFFKFENFSKKEDAAQTHEKKQKKRKLKRKRERKF